MSSVRSSSGYESHRVSHHMHHVRSNSQSPGNKATHTHSSHTHTHTHAHTHMQGQCAAKRVCTVDIGGVSLMRPQLAW